MIDTELSIQDLLTLRRYAMKVKDAEFRTADRLRATAAGKNAARESAIGRHFDAADEASALVSKLTGILLEATNA